MFDVSGINGDEVEGIVTCGSTLMAAKGKQNIKMWKVQDCISSYATVKSYGSKTKFAVSYDGSLGAQITYSQIPTVVYNTTTSTITSMTGYTGTFLGTLNGYTGSYTGSDGYYTGTYGPLTVQIFSTGPLGPTVAISQSVSTTTSSIIYTTGPTYTYGNVTESITIPRLPAPLNGSLCYAGKQGGKDVFILCVLGASVMAAHGNCLGSPWIPINDNRKVNLSQIIEGNRPTITPDGKAMIFTAPKNANISSYAGNVFAQMMIYPVHAITLSDDSSRIKYLWTTITTAPAHPQLSANNPATSNNVGANGTSFAASNYTRQTAGLTSSSPFVVNDLLIHTNSASLLALRIDTGEIVAQHMSDDFDWDESWLPNLVTTSAGTTMNAQEEHGFGAATYNDGSLYIIAGAYGGNRSNGAGFGRNLHRLDVKYQTPQALNLTSLFVATGSAPLYNSQTVVFTPQDAISQNSNQWCLLSTFKTTDYFNNKKSQYIAKDLDYDGLFLSGVTAIAIYDPSNKLLEGYQTASLDISTRFINGGSWYERTGISFKNLLASGVVKFLYAGQIPYKCRAQTPFVVSEDQIQEAVIVRRQKKLLQEYYRAKNGNTLPYPDNGLFVENNAQYYNTVNFKPYFYTASPTDTTLSAIYNQPLGYTDVGTGRPLTAPTTN